MDFKNTNIKSFRIGRLLFSLCIVIAISNAVSAQQPARKIDRIEAEGLQTLTTETVVATSGLKIGDNFSVDATDAAAQRLVDSGLFKKVGYRTRTLGTNITIVFQLEELKGNNSPVVFDNFIWFSDEELAAAVKREVPSFNGSAPDAGNTNEAIRQALQHLLTAHKLPGHVEYVLTETEHLFRVAGVPMKICSLHFPGAHHVPEEKLVHATRNSMDPDYSRQSARTFPKYGLFPIYRELGHLRATFAPAVAKPDSSPGCEGGVDLTIPINEGPAYLWAIAQWSRNQLLAARDLDAALGMKPGEVANGLKFDKGVNEVKKAYGKHGHIETRLIAEPEFDEAGPRVTYKIDVNEGPQYRMGTVEFKGFSEADTRALREKWRLKTGEIYDQSYLDQFFRNDAASITSKIASDRRAQQKPFPPLDSRPIPDRQSLTVNVTVEIKY